jgi:transcriptional regulator with XRE-family HTH domain
LGCCIFFPNLKTTLIGANPEYIDIAFGEFGERLFRRRRELELNKRDVAARLGVHHEMIGKWERGEHVPRVSCIPALIGFLGDDTWLPFDSFSRRVYRCRALRGWSRERMGTWLGVDARTVGRWEAGLSPRPEARRAFDQMIRAAERS